MYNLKVTNYMNTYDLSFTCKTLDILLEFCKQELTNFYDTQDDLEDYYNKDHYKTIIKITDCNIHFCIFEKFNFIVRFTIRDKEDIDATIKCIDNFFCNMSKELNECDRDCMCDCCRTINTKIQVIR